MKANTPFYSASRFLYCLLSILLLLCGNITVSAQEERNRDTVVIDTVIQEILPEAQEEEADEEKENPFTLVTDTLSITERNVPADAVQQLKKDKAFWYADADIKRDKSGQLVADDGEKGKQLEKGKNEQGIREVETGEAYVPLGQRSWFQTFLWILIVGVFVAGLFFYLGSSQIGLFRRKNLKVAGEEAAEEISEDIFAIRYTAEIEKAVARGDFRLAVRLHFLRLLKELSTKQVIRYQQGKTNFDYLSELQPARYYPHFFRLTRHYEYSWYGQFPVSREAYAIISRDFEQFDKSLAGS